MNSLFAVTNATAKATAESLYAGIDLSAVSYAEQLWARWYIYIGDPSLATGLMSFLLHEFFYFGRCIPWMIIDQLPSFRKYKLQPVSLVFSSTSKGLRLIKYLGLSRTRFLPQHNSGNAQNMSYILISPSSSPEYGFSTLVQNTLACRLIKCPSLRGLKFLHK